ncbi:MAG: DUF4426 domain-containing protein, partial [Pseudomonadota bacterium]
MINCLRKLPGAAITLAATWLLLTAPSALGQLSERFGPYELHYSVVNTTFLEPEVAAEYGIARGRRR